jgi:hypothetical protein
MNSFSGLTKLFKRMQDIARLNAINECMSVVRSLLMLYSISMSSTIKKRAKKIPTKRPIHIPASFQKGGNIPECYNEILLNT